MPLSPDAVAHAVQVASLAALPPRRVEIGRRSGALALHERLVRAQPSVASPAAAAALAPPVDERRFVIDLAGGEEQTLERRRRLIDIRDARDHELAPRI